MTTVAVPAAYSDDLAPVVVTFEIDATQDELFAADGLDYEQVTAARAIVTRSDGVRLEWPLEIAVGATETAITLTYTLDVADLFDASLLPVAPGTYEVRIFATDPDGEHVLPMLWLPVERL